MTHADMTIEEARAALIWCPFPGENAARTAIATLLDERLIACGNMLPGMTSLFAWEGGRDEGRECGVLCKTAVSRLDAALARLADLHPYETPAIAGWPVSTTSETANWLEQETASRA